MRFRFHRGPLNVYPVRTVAPRRRSVPAATGTARTALALLPVAALRLTSVVSMQDRHFAGLSLLQRAGESPRWPL